MKKQNKKKQNQNSECPLSAFIWYAVIYSPTHYVPQTFQILTLEGGLFVDDVLFTHRHTHTHTLEVSEVAASSYFHLVSSK